MPPTDSIEPPGVFIDTAGFIALYVPDDAHHLEAVQFRDQTLKSARLYTSSDVVSETVGHIQRDGLLDQQSLSLLVADFLNQKRWISYLPIDESVIVKALKLVNVRYNSRFSLVDATNIVLMETHRIDMIFSYDWSYDGVTVQRGYTPRLIRRVG